MVRVFPLTIHLCFSLTVTALLLKSANSQDYYVYEPFIHANCTAEKQFERGSEYQKNRYNLLSNLTSKSDSRQFYNTTSGESPNKVYGLYQCYRSYGSDNEFCEDCIENAVKEIVKNCTTSVEGIAWYEDCMIRYADHNIFSINDVSIYHSYGTGTVRYSQYNELLTHEFTRLAEKASSGDSLLLSAFAYSNPDDEISIVISAECNQDISRSDCRICFDNGLRRLQLKGHSDGGVVQPSCRMVYSISNYTDYQEPAPSPAQVVFIKPAVQNKKIVHIGIGVISALVGLCLMLMVALIYYVKRRKTTRKPNGLDEIESMESLHMEYEAIKAATYNFSDDNKLGKGGFGVVYKGILANGQAVAVKRLSNSSGQGIREFKAEACLAAKLQHRNLVKVYGFCLEGQEMLLVYEFVPNKSLDRFLFDANRGAYLDWKTRHKIIVGIARGLVYLHEDSCPKIIHRDLKPSNILLDGEMNPKIADFGMAKLFGGEQTQGNTSRIAGTFGYMAPEYSTTGHFSIKSDIFSFGVILLEIVSGLMNRCSTINAQEGNLLSYAWKLWNTGEHLTLVDHVLGNNFSTSDVDRCIHVGLLCTQEDPTKRPNMASVLNMLNTQLNSVLPSPASPPNIPYKPESSIVSNGSSGIRIEDVVTELSPR